MELTEAIKELYFALYGNGDNFHTLLYRLIGKADRFNFERLRLAYPQEVQAFEMWRDSKGTQDFFTHYLGTIFKGDY